MGENVECCLPACHNGSTLGVPAFETPALSLTKGCPSRILHKGAWAGKRALSSSSRLVRPDPVEGCLDLGKGTNILVSIISEPYAGRKKSETMRPTYKYAIFAILALASMVLFFVGLFAGLVPLVIIGAATLFVLFVVRRSFIPVTEVED